MRSHPAGTANRNLREWRRRHRRKPAPNARARIFIRRRPRRIVVAQFLLWRQFRVEQFIVELRVRFGRCDPWRVRLVCADMARRFALLAISLCSSKYIDDRAQAPEPFVDEIKGIVEARRQIICLISKLRIRQRHRSRSGNPDRRSVLISARRRRLPSARAVSSPRHRHERPAQRSAGTARAVPGRA